MSRGDVKADFDKARHMMAEKDFLKKLKDFDPTTVSAEQKAVLADQLKKEAVCETGPVRRCGQEGVGGGRAFDGLARGDRSRARVSADSAASRAGGRRT